MDLSTLDAVVRDVLEQRKVPGLSIAAFEEEEVALRCWGNASADRAVEERTVFEAASMGKAVTTYAALTLVADGLIDLDEPLCRYARNKYVDDDRIEAVTARHAVTHQSGLWVATNDVPAHFEKDPAIEFKYSNAGFMYLQAVIEQVTGEPFDEVARRRVLVALGMKDSSYVWRPDYEGRFAVPHNTTGDVLHDKWRPEVAWSPGSLHTTAKDFARFMQALMTRRGPLPENLVDEMLTPQVEVQEAWGGGAPDPGSWWGLGIGVQTSGPRSFWHWGWNDGFLSFAVAWPDELRGVVALTNGMNGLWVCKDVLVALSGRVHPAFRWLEH